jgi:hypothetical protein
LWGRAEPTLRFYERFGDDLTNELVDWLNQMDASYRIDLRELNDPNFARFESKLDAGLARLEGGLLARIAQAESRLARNMLTFQLTSWLTTVGIVIALLKL